MTDHNNPPASLPDVEAGLDLSEMGRFFNAAVELGRGEGGPSAAHNRLLVTEDFRCAVAAIQRQHRAVVAPLEAKVADLQAQIARLKEGR